MINIIQCEISSNTIPIKLESTDHEYTYFVEFNPVDHLFLKLFKINILKQIITSYEFKHPSHFMTIKSVKERVYYGSINNERIQLYSVDLESFSEEEVISISLAMTTKVHPILISFEPLLLLALPHSELELEKDSYYFNNILLIDTEEKRHFDFSVDLSDVDSILRFEDLWVSGDRKHLVLKTGRIRSFEKRRFWGNSQSSGFNDSTDQIENLIMFDMNSLIESCKKKMALTEYHVLQCSDELSTNGFIGFDNTAVIYFVNIFSEGVSYIKTFDWESKTTSSRILDSLYDSINYQSGTLYGFVNGRSYRLIGDIQEVKPVLIYQDNDVEISYKKEPEIINENIIIKCSISVIHKLDNKPSSFTCNHFIYDSDSNSLLLITNIFIAGK